MTFTPNRTHLRRTFRLTRLLTALSILLGIVGPMTQATPAFAATVTSATFTGGGAGTATVAGSLYAKSGASLTLSVVASSDTKCVLLTNSIGTPLTGLVGGNPQNSTTAKTNWTFLFAAGAGDGIQAVTAAASPNFNINNVCTGQSQQPKTGSFVLDNTAPTLSYAFTQTPNTAGWNNANFKVEWSTTDGGSGVVGANPFITDTVNANTSGTTLSQSATDRVGNIGSGSVTVKLDKAAPTILGSRSPAANANGWNNTDVTVSYSCSDAISGIKSCSASATLSANAANQSATGTATDNADNAASVTVSGINIDKVAPVLGGAPTTAANADGWYNTTVAITWTCSDALSGINGACPANSSLAGEGSGQTANASVSDKAGNTTNATSSPAVNIDKTKPNTSANAPAGWTNNDVTVALTPIDGLSGIKSTFYILDGGTQQNGTSIHILTQGIHTLSFWSIDKAGNIENQKTIEVKIDLTGPNITGSQSPAANSDGWNNSDVTVSYSCTDAHSGIEFCEGSSTLTAETAGQLAWGSVRDNSGNAGSASVGPVKIDKTAPALSGAPTTSPNADGWYNGNVTIHWTATDGLSGIAAAPADSVISSEGSAQTASTSVSDKAGNSTTAASSPAVNIDKTKPNTAASAPGTWNNTNVTVNLMPNDGLSGIKATYYTVDGGATQSGTSIVINTEGIHTLTFWSEDKAGNVEDVKTVQVKIDFTPPTITHSQSPVANGNGWNNGDVTVTFICADAMSGIASCTSPQTVTSEGKDQPVTGTATDNAGNTTEDPATVSIDKAEPTISAVPDRAANDNGWYNADVTVTFTCGDSLSGIDLCPAPQSFGEGANQTASGTAADTAGNTASASASNINIDKTDPTISGAATTAPNANGWYKADVIVDWTCSDALSGIDGVCPSDSTVTGEGSNLSASASTSDKAGNQASASMSGLKIDRTAPSTSASAPAPLPSGWYAGPVQVMLNAADSLSGVDATYYSVDGGATQTYGGAFTFSQGGIHTIRFWSSDKAGNVEDNTGPDHEITLKIDNLAPTISGSRAPAANGFGWNNSPVAVSFFCNDAESGIASCAGNTTLLTQGAGQSASGTATDNAGNTASATVSNINIDLTDPTVSGATTTAPNANGWYKTDVTVEWTTSDDLSGIAPATDPADTVVTGEGASLSAGPVSVSDKAGNVGSGAVSGIKIDRTPPSTSASVPAPLPSGWYASAVLVTLNAFDALSTVDATYYSVDGGAAQTYSGPFSFSQGGVHTVRFWSSDKAGNTEDSSAPGHSIEIKIDNVAPTITGSRSPAANSFGWNNGPVDVTFACNDAESGIASCIGDATVTNEGAGQSVIGQAQDSANNIANASVTDINIDLTAPTVSGAATTAPNAAGWYKNDVVIQWTALDGLSGADPSTVPANSTVTGEGSNLGAGPVNASDKAGNVGSGSVSGIKIDRTAPTISGAPTTAANAAGWYNSAVRIRFTCNDALSLVQECAADVVLDANGAGQSASGSATDMADNASSTTVSGIKIDGLAPQSTAAESCTSKNGWCRGNIATVLLSAVDQTGLSGVKEIRYSVNGGTWKTDAGASTSVNVPLAAQSGLATVQFYAVDNAGNTEPMNGISLKYDNLAPTVTHVNNPLANAAGWNKVNTNVAFSAVDDAGGSGVDASTWLNQSVLVSTETTAAGQTIVGSVMDLAGNLGSDSALVKLDKTAPTIGGAATTSPNANGWYKGPVTVHFNCTDVRSGVATCAANVVLTSNGANQSASGTAEDAADNTASTTVSGINIDTVAPAITVNGVANGGSYPVGGVPAISCTATDALSGVDGACVVTVSGGSANGTGNFSYSATAKDKAGNTTTVTGSYKATYRFDGFLQPINDTAHQTCAGCPTSIFKGGSTVPVKFQLKDANGNAVQANSLPQWLTPVKGTATTLAIDESVYSDPSTNGNTYRWDATAQQYIYNWSTKNMATGYYWRVGVMLDDGQTYVVYIGLR